MIRAWLGCLVFGGLLFGGTQDSDINVNTRYVVDAVTIWGKGWRADLAADHTDAAAQLKKLSSPLRHDLIALIGKNLRPGALDALAARLRNELGAREVRHRLQRGDSPDHVRVEFEVKPPHFTFDTTVTKFAYDSKAGWSGGGDAGFTVQDQSFGFGMVSDGDTDLERFAGITARYENHHLGSDRLTFKLKFESYHEQWNNHTIEAAEAIPDLTSNVYRTRENLQPTLAVTLAKPLVLEVGTSFEKLQEEQPGYPIVSANALFATLRFHQRLESDLPQDLDAVYAVRSANGLLGSDFIYTSHAFDVRYQVQHGKHVLRDILSAGVITGRAPLADRFVLGTSTMLRGWNKYDLDPVGGNRMVHNSVEYRYGPFQAFYDTGAIWDDGQAVSPKHSLGIGIRESVLSVAVAFPVRGGRVEPIFMMGLLY